MVLGYAIVLNNAMTCSYHKQLLCKMYFKTNLSILFYINFNHEPAKCAHN